jgi:serine/threonine protein kinase
MSPNTPIVAKIADFGMSSTFCTQLENDGSVQCRTFKRNAKFNILAPEVLSIVTRQYTNSPVCYDGRKADVWACGVLLYTLLAARFPFKYANSIDSRFAEVYIEENDVISNARRESLRNMHFKDTSSESSFEVYDLLSKIFCHHSQRLTIDEVCLHPYCR